MHDCFTDCKTLIVFCYILSLTHCKGTATGSLQTQPIHDPWREKCFRQKMSSLGDVGRCLCPQRASAHPSKTGVLFSKSRPQRWHTTTSASESREFHPEESGGATASQTQGLQSPEGPPDIPQLTVCPGLSLRGHCARSCDTQLNQRTPFQKGLSTERGQ